MSNDSFATTVAKALNDAGGTEFVRAHLEDYPTWAGTHTALLEQLGLPYMLVPDSLDGIGPPMADVVDIATITGSLPSVDVVGRYVMAPLLLHGADDELLGQLAEGEARVSVAYRGRVVGSADLTHAVVVDGDTARIVDVAGHGGQVRTSFDQTSPIFEVTTDGAATITVDLATYSRALAAGRTALAAEQAGLASAIVAETTQFLKDRVEFARLLAPFQALKRRMADMWSAVSMLPALVAGAAAALDANDTAEVEVYSRGIHHVSWRADRAECVDCLANGSTLMSGRKVDWATVALRPFLNRD